MGKGNRKLILIMAPSHSGSTLVDLVISSATEAFGLGEIHAIRKDKYKSREVPICSIHHENCTFWNESRWNKIENYLIQNRVKRQLSRFINYRYKLYDYLMKESGKRVLIDSSKYPEWVQYSMKKIKQTNIEVYLVYLLRDPRAICNSWHRKYPEWSMDKIISEHKANLKKMNNVFEEAAVKKIKVYYEDIATEPNHSFGRLFSFMNENYSQDYIKYWQYEHHHIGGNSGTKSLIHKYQSSSSGNINKNTKSYYEDHELTIKHDERWRRELSKESLSLIEREFELNEN